MKKTVLILMLSAGFVAVLMNWGKQTSSWSMDVPRATMSKVADWINLGTEGGTETSAQARDIKTFKDMAESVEDLYYKVVRTSEEKELWIKLISSKENIDDAVSNVRVYDSQNVKDNERARMQAVLFLVRSLEFDGNKNKEYIKNKVSELILDESVEAITNKDLKRSVIADRIELFVSAKEKYPELGQKIQNQASSKLQKDLITFANNFYELDKKGEVK